MVRHLKQRAEFPVNRAISLLGVPRASYFRWAKTNGKVVRKRRPCPKSNYLLESEKKRIIAYKQKHPEVGYRRLAYMMLDEGIVAVPPSSVYRVLREADLSNRWTEPGTPAKKEGYKQPRGPHEQWHTDISYLNIAGTHYFFIGVLDGYSRSIVHHEVRTDMTGFDVQVVLCRALEKIADTGKHPRLITDNGGQFIANDFKNFLRERDISHSRSRPRHPQSNGKIERFHKSLKGECVRRTPMGTLKEARRLIKRYVDDYNNNRLHAALQYLSPADYLKGEEHIARRLQERQEKLQAAKAARKEWWQAAA